MYHGLMKTRLTDIERVLELNGWIDSDEHVGLRTRARLTQEFIATATGVSKGCISRYESGLRRPAGRTALAYHRVLRRLADAEAQAEAKVARC